MISSLNPILPTEIKINRKELIYLNDLHYRYQGTISVRVEYHPVESAEFYHEYTTLALNKFSLYFSHRINSLIHLAEGFIDKMTIVEERYI